MVGKEDQITSSLSANNNTGGSARDQRASIGNITTRIDDLAQFLVEIQFEHQEREHAEERRQGRASATPDRGDADSGDEVLEDYRSIAPSLFPSSSTFSTTAMLDHLHSNFSSNRSLIFPHILRPSPWPQTEEGRRQMLSSILTQAVNLVSGDDAGSCSHSELHSSQPGQLISAGNPSVEGMHQHSGTNTTSMIQPNRLCGTMNSGRSEEEISSDHHVDTDIHEGEDEDISSPRVQ